MQRYCALEDRSIQKVREKLYAIDDLSDSDTQEIIQSLVEDKFLDDQRFVESYVRSKVNQKKWGVWKIRHGLIRHRIEEALIEKGLQQIDTSRYRDNLTSLLRAKKNTTDDRAAWIRYLLQRGYEYDEISQVIGDA